MCDLIVCVMWRAMGWLWLVGSLKLQVSFAKEPYKRDDVLQKRPVILRSLLIVATPYDFICVSSSYVWRTVLWLVRGCNTTLSYGTMPSYVWRTVLWLVRGCNTTLSYGTMPSYVWVHRMCDVTCVDLFGCVTRLIHMCEMTWCAMTYSHVWHHSFIWHYWASTCLFICVTWLIHISRSTSRHTYAWVTSHIWMSHGTHISESRHTDEWVMAHIWISHVTQMNESCHTDEWVMSHIWMSHVTQMKESCHTYE